jgi:hypothetical protein
VFNSRGLHHFLQHIEWYFSMEFYRNCSMESIWTVPWNPYGIVHGFAIYKLQIHWKFHGIHMDQSMESIWNALFHGHSIWIPYWYGMKKWLGCQPKNSPWNSMEWGWNPPIPYGIHMEYTGECKDLCSRIIPKVDYMFTSYLYTPQSIPPPRLHVRDLVHHSAPLHLVMRVVFVSPMWFITHPF